MKHILFLSLFFISATGFSQKKKAECPMGHGSESKTETTQTREAALNSAGKKDWWPSKLNLEVLKQHSEKTNPMGANFDYAKEFKTLDYYALKKDIQQVLTNSHDWWPADF